MALYKIADLYPNYQESVFAGYRIQDLEVFSDRDNHKVGSVHDLIVDESGRFRYFVIDTGLWIFGKKVLLPVGKVSIDYNLNRVYALGLTREQVENLPEYKDNIVIDYDYEEKVRTGYRGQTANYNRDTYNYDSEPELYAIHENNPQNLKLYEERLVVDKDRFRTGGVTIGKHVETETAKASVPVEKERVVIERTVPKNTEFVNPENVSFGSGEVAQIDVYEETADIRKQAFVAEEVAVRKEVKTDSVEAQETVRRERLDVDVEGNPGLVDHNR